MKRKRKILITILVVGIFGLGAWGISYAASNAGGKIPVKNTESVAEAGAYGYPVLLYENYVRDWEPFQEMSVLQNRINRLFEDTYRMPWGETGRETTGFYAPRLDVEEHAGRYVIKADIPGVDKNQLNVSVTEGALTLSGERKVEEETTRKGFHRVERSFGSFQRVIPLPEDADTTQVTANYDKGVLTIEMPKKEVAPGKKVKRVPVQ